MEKEGIFGKIVCKTSRNFLASQSMKSVLNFFFWQGPQGTSWFIRVSSGSVDDSLMQVGHCFM